MFTKIFSIGKKESHLDNAPGEPTSNDVRQADVRTKDYDSARKQMQEKIQEKDGNAPGGELPLSNYGTQER